MTLQYPSALYRVHRGFFAWLPLAVSFWGCSGAQSDTLAAGTDPRTDSDAGGVRNRPRRRAVNAALASAATNAITCLEAGSTSQVTVHGTFTGVSGAFGVENIEGVADSGRAACVKEKFAQARVDPFRQEAYSISHTFGVNGETINQIVHPHSLYALMADGGVAQDDAGYLSLTQGGPSILASDDAGAGPSTPTIVPETVTGSRLENTMIGEVMKSRVDDVRACYEVGRRSDPALSILVRVRVSIAPDGTATRVSSTAVARAGAAELAGDVAGCIERVVSATRFPARTTGTAQDVFLPFNLVPSASLPPTPGHADPAAVFASLQGQSVALRGCYEHALRTDPPLAGRVRVRFVIDPTGAVIYSASEVNTTAGIATSMTNVGHCVEGVINGLKLPAPTGGNAALELPLDFSPRGQ